MPRLAVHTPPFLDAGAAAAISSGGLDRTLAADAELVIAPIEGDAILLGAFQRASELGKPGTSPSVVLARGSGGHAVRARTGVLFVHLALARPAALIACDAERIVNRHVRPLLSAIGRFASPVSYFGRDWIAVDHRPASFVGFAHDARTGRALFEAFVAVGAPYALGPRSSFRGNEPVTLAEVAKKDVPIVEVTAAAIEAYLDAYGTSRADLATVAAGPAGAGPDEIPWAATREDAIGLIGAGPDRAGVMRVGGELMGSRDAIADLDFDRREAILFGARADTLRAVLAAARGAAGALGQ